MPRPFLSPFLSCRKGQRERTDESTKSCLIPALWGLGEEGLLPSRSRLLLLLLLPSTLRRPKAKVSPESRSPLLPPPSFHPPTCSAVAYLTGGRWSSPPPLLFFMGGVGRRRIKEGTPPPAREQKPDDWSGPRVRDRFN